MYSPLIVGLMFYGKTKIVDNVQIMNKRRRSIVLVIYNVRSAHNVGSLLRTADGLGIERVYMIGYTPYPSGKNDPRLPHISARVDAQIQKTALGAEKTVDWEHFENLEPMLKQLRSKRFIIAALEQSKNSITLPTYQPPKKIALIVGTETTGLDKEVLKGCDETLEIPMLGKKESLNVASAGAICLYHLRFAP